MTASFGRLTQSLAVHLRQPLYRNGYALLFNGAATSGLGLVYWAVAAHLYSPATVGINSALVAALLLLAGMAQLSLNNVLIRFIPVAGAMTRRLILYSYLASSLAAVVIAIVFISAINLWSPALGFLNTNLAWQLSFVLAIATWCIFSLQDSVLTGLRQTVWVPIENSIFAVVKLILVVFLAGPMAQMGIFLSWTIPVAISLFPVNALIFGRLLPRRVIPPRTVVPNTRQLVNFAGANYIGSLLFLAYTNLLPLVVANQAGAEATAYFYIPWTISAGLLLIATNLSVSLIVEASLEVSKLRSFGRRIMIQSFRLLVPIVIGIFIGAPWILRIFGTNYASHGTALMRWLALASLPNVIIVLALSIARVQHRSRWVIFVQAAICVLVLGISYAILPAVGIVAVGWGWFASQMIVAAILLLTLLRPIFTGER